MFQYMTPIDYMRTSMALWSRTAELQVEMMRMSMGMADSWTGGVMKPNPALMQLFTPTGLSTDAKKAPASSKPAPKAAAPKAPARRPARPAAPVAKLVPVEAIEASEAKVMPEAKEARKAAATPEADIVAPKPAPKAATPRRRAPSKPKAPQEMTKAVAPVEDVKPAPAKPSRPKAAAAAPAADSASKPAPRRRAPAKKAAPASKTGDAPARKPVPSSAATKKDGE